MDVPGGEEIAAGLAWKKSALEALHLWSCRQTGRVPPKSVVEILHCSQHLVEEFLATFVTQMKSAKIGNKVLSSRQLSG